MIITIGCSLANILSLAASGTNILKIVGTNYGDNVYGWTQDSNPAGLIFRGEVKYLVPSETAWGAGIGLRRSELGNILRLHGSTDALQ